MKQALAVADPGGIKMRNSQGCWNQTGILLDRQESFRNEFCYHHAVQRIRDKLLKFYRKSYLNNYFRDAQLSEGDFP